VSINASTTLRAALQIPQGSPVGVPILCFSKKPKYGEPNPARKARERKATKPLANQTPVVKLKGKPF
jgi:hypothetical protein